MEDELRIRVLLAGELPLVRAGLRKVLEEIAWVEVIGEAVATEQVAPMCERLRPNVVFYDLAAHGPGRLEPLSKLLRRLRSSIRVLVHTVSDNIAVIDRAMKGGAWGCLTATATPEILEQALREIMAGARYMEPEPAHRLALWRVSPDNALLHSFTDRELTLLMMAAEGCTLSAVGEILHLSPRTLAVQYKRLREKAGVVRKRELAQLALRHRLVRM